MRKIVHMTSVHPVQDVRIFHKECLSLKAMGYDVTLIAPADKNQVLEGIKIIAVKKTQSRFLRMILLPWQIYHKALQEQADSYHFHDPELIIIGLLLKRKRKKVIYDVHEDVPRDILLKNWLPKLLRKFIANLFEKFEQRAANNFSAVVTVTPRISQRFAKNNVFEIRNYPSMNEYEFVQPPLENRILCYTGLINPQRGISEMVNLTKNNDLSLFLAGQFCDEKLKNQVIQSTQNVYYLGYLDRAGLQKVYQRSLAGLALLHSGPTFNDALPIKLFEYMAAGLPVIASNFPLWREIVEQHGCGFCVDPLDSNEILGRIHFLAENNELAREMGQRGREAIRKHYHWDTQVSKLASLYNQVLEN